MSRFAPVGVSPGPLPSHRLERNAVLLPPLSDWVAARPGHLSASGSAMTRPVYLRSAVVASSVLCIASHWFSHDFARSVSVSGLDPSTGSQRLERDAVLLHLLSDWVVTSAGHRPASDWITAQAIEFGSTISVSFCPPDTDLRLERDAGHLPPLSNWSPHGPEICPQAVGSPHNPSNPDQRLALQFCCSTGISVGHAAPRLPLPRDWVAARP